MTATASSVPVSTSRMASRVILPRALVTLGSRARARRGAATSRNMAVRKRARGRMKDQFKGKVAGVTGGRKAWRGDRAPSRRARGGGPCRRRPQQETRQAVAEDITGNGCKTIFVAADLGDIAAVRKIGAGRSACVRPRRCPGECHGHHRSRHAGGYEARSSSTPCSLSTCRRRSS